jgi:hypothetical protein
MTLIPAPLISHLIVFECELPPLSRISLSLLITLIRFQTTCLVVPFLCHTCLRLTLPVATKSPRFRIFLYFLAVRIKPLKMQEVSIALINEKYKFTQKFTNNHQVDLAYKLNEESIIEDTIYNLDVTRITSSSENTK